MESKAEVSIPCNDIELEGILQFPESIDRPCPGAVICHPHPLYGGNMHNNVAVAIAEGLLTEGVVCLRFNFRGTGRSGGRHGEGSAEIEDVRAAMDFLTDNDNVDSARLIVAGYSFGCWVGLNAAAQDERPGMLVGVSPPVDMYDFSFLHTEQRPKLLIAGDRDFVCNHSAFVKLGEQVPEPKTIVTMPGADHFHFGREHILLTAIIDFYRSHGA